MATAAQHFDRILALCRVTCMHITLIVREERPQRALLKLTARYNDFELHISEIVFPDGSRKYAYYVLNNQKIIVGFDNAPDPEALKLKYGTKYARHRLETLPHRHTANKANIMLTDAIEFEQFLTWIQENLLGRGDL